MKTLYLLTRGSYSDYAVVGIFSTDEKRKEFMNLVPGSEYNEEEIVLDPVIPEFVKGRSFFTVTMSKTGHVICPPYSSESQYFQTQYWFLDRQDKITVEVWAKDSDHAVKIANEIRTRLIALDQWGIAINKANEEIQELAKNNFGE